MDQNVPEEVDSRTHPPVIAQNYSAPLQIQNLYSRYWMMGTLTGRPEEVPTNITVSSTFSL